MGKQARAGRLVDRLSERKIAELIRAGKRGRFPDGNGLYLQLQGRPGNAASWIHLYRHERGERSMAGLGSFPLNSLADARKKRDDARRILQDEHRDPYAAARAQRLASARMTFGEAAEQSIAGREGAWKDPKVAALWRSTLLGDYCAPIVDMAVADVGRADVLRVLQPIWRTRTATASKLRARIEKVLSWAVANGRRPEGDNPARWASLEHDLPAPSKVSPTVNRAALPYSELPAFVRDLRTRQGEAAVALELTILAASRAGEVMGATVGEFDLERVVWEIPASRMKSGRPHAVPLSRRAAEIVAAAIEGKAPGDLLFGYAGAQLDDSSLRAVLRRMGVKTTVHGFRSAFRDWAGNETRFPRELAEHALAHRIGDASEQAYRRSTALERRRPLMQSWSNFCEGVEMERVLRLAQ